MREEGEKTRFTFRAIRWIFYDSLISVVRVIGSSSRGLKILSFEMLNSCLVGIIAFLLILNADAKVYEKCELARELRDRYIPYEQIGPFVCIAERQSNFNTEAVNQGLYFGMYQIGSEFWCDQDNAGKACNVQCSDLLDDDLADDLACVRIIFDEHQRIFNNGFSAWPSSQSCQLQGNLLIEECFIEENQIIQSYESVARQEKQSGNVDEGKVYERCELARELLYQYNIPMEQIATWVCIAKHESAFNTSAIGRLNWDGSEDHGLFQISDIYWCGESGKSCGAKCSEFRNNDISDDVKCIKQIHQEHQRLSGDGFNAWAVYPRCKGSAQPFADGCFDQPESENEIMPYKPVPGIQQPQKNYVDSGDQRKYYENNIGIGKIYERCELAQELRFKYKIPMEQVATWVCIANHESNFNTSAIGRLNADGSEDHGLFQISDIYWCSPPGTGTGCGLTCSKLEDNDISDDVECMLKIYEEHTYLSGDGFTAWAVYRPNCLGRSLGYIDGCFNENVEFIPRPAITQPPTFTYPTNTQPPAITQPKTPFVTLTNEPITTVSRAFDTTPIDTTIKYSEAPVTSLTKSTTESVETSVATVKDSYNAFDTFYDKASKESLNNEIYPNEENIKVESESFVKQEQPLGFELVKEAPIIETTARTTTSLRTTSSTTTKPRTTAATTTRPRTTAATTTKPRTTAATTTRPRTTASTTPRPRTTAATTTRPRTTTTKTTTTKPRTATSTRPFLTTRSSTTSRPTTSRTTFRTTTPRPTTKSTTRLATTKERSTTARPSSTLTTTARFYHQGSSNNDITRESTLTRQTTLRISNSKPINHRTPSAITNKPSLLKNDGTPTTTIIGTTPRITQKISRQSNVVQSRDEPQTKRKAVTLKPFNVFDFFLNDYTSKSPINYKPVQFSDRSTVVIKRVENYDKTPRSTVQTSSTNVFKYNPEVTTRSNNVYKVSTDNPLSVYNAFNDYNFNSNRIGRVVKNITPHSFDYLLKLTTPRTHFSDARRFN